MRLPLNRLTFIGLLILQSTLDAMILTMCACVLLLTYKPTPRTQADPTAMARS
jgi:hypothetical protein